MDLRMTDLFAGGYRQAYNRFQALGSYAATFKYMKHISTEARSLDAGLAEVFSRHVNLDAHLRESRTHAIANSVAKRGLSRSAFGIGACAIARRKVGVVGGNDGRQFVVVARVEDEGDRIPHPLVGLLRAQIVEHQHFSGKDR